MQIADRVKKIIAEQLGLETSEVAEDKSMLQLGADQLDEVEIAMGLEDDFEIEIPDSRYLQGDGKTTVAEVINVIERMVG